MAIPLKVMVSSPPQAGNACRWADYLPARKETIMSENVRKAVSAFLALEAGEIPGFCRALNERYIYVNVSVSYVGPAPMIESAQQSGLPASDNESSPAASSN